MLVLENIKFSPETEFSKEYYTALIKHPTGHWLEELNIHESSYCKKTYICPVFEKINDIIAIHFLILYVLSIIVRYYPSLWYEIERGKYSCLLPLLEHYLTIFDNTIPLIMLKRISDKEIKVSKPWGLFS